MTPNYTESKMMFPSVGAGAFGLKAPPQVPLFRTSLVNRAFYGLGLAISLIIIVKIFRSAARGENRS